MGQSQSLGGTMYSVSLLPLITCVLSSSTEHRTDTRQIFRTDIRQISRSIILTHTRQIDTQNRTRTLTKDPPTQHRNPIQHKHINSLNLTKHNLRSTDSLTRRRRRWIPNHLPTNTQGWMNRDWGHQR